MLFQLACYGGPMLLRAAPYYPNDDVHLAAQWQLEEKSRMTTHVPTFA
jgi:hypothetical protein